MKKNIICFLAVTALIMSLAACKMNVQTDDPTLESSTEEFSSVAPENITEAQTQEQTEATTKASQDIALKAGSTATVLGDGKTYTGLPSLPLVQFKVEDPENTRGLNNEKKGYGFGVAKDGKPNQISVNNQAYFDNGGFNALALDTKTQEKVLYLTFDCGYENGYTAKILDTLKEKNVPAVFFCTLPQVKDYPQLIARMINEGHIVGNHSVTHPSFPTISRIQMAEEIQGMDDYLRTNFGYSEPYFRYPMGEYSDNALELVNSLGYKCIFWSVAYSDWDLSNQKGKDYAFKTVTDRLHPGAVILLHAVSPDNSAALGDIIDYARGQGYTFKSLRDYNG